MADLSKRIAIVYDWIDKYGGAEKILLALHDVFPEAELHTLIYKKNKTPWADRFKITTSFLQLFKFLPRQILIVFAPLAFESFNFSNYDLVISVSSQFAHGIITKPTTRHYAIVLTPARYLYLNQQDYKVFWLFKPFESILKKYLRFWDKIACHRPDKIFAISKTVQNRITKHWSKSSELLYPPVKIPKMTYQKKQDYYLYLGRLETYKNPVLITQIFNQIGLNLIVAGTGSLLPKLKSIAKPNIKILGEVSETQKWELLARARALLFFHEEDFGIVPIEAMACGTPVLGLNKGGVSETVINGKTGMLLNNLSPKDIVNAIINFDPKLYSTNNLINQSKIYSYESFIRTCSLWR